MSTGVPDSELLQKSPARAGKRVAWELRRRWLGLWLLAAAVLVLGLYVGRGDLSDTALAPTFYRLRWTRGAVAFLAGGGLAVAGVLAQGLFRNPLASPSVLGATFGAALGGEVTLVALQWLCGGHAPLGLAGEMLTPIGCVAGAALALALVLGLSPLRASSVALLLTGFLLSALLSSLSALLKSLVQDHWQLLRALTTLSLGSVSGAGPRQLALAALLSVGSALPAWSLWRELDVLMSGEEEARSLGVDVVRLRFWIVVWTGFATAGAVAVGANVTFVGLIVPHVLRRFFGQGHRSLIPAAFVGGGVFLVACDVGCRAVPLRSELPLGVVTALIGAPLFLRLLARVEGGAS